MTNQNFSKDSLVEYSYRIYKVLEPTDSGDNPHYKLQLIAFLTAENTSIEFMPSHILSDCTIAKNKLKAFNGKAPRYAFNERVRWTDDRKETYYCLVKFILFENHQYLYRLLEEARIDQGYWMNYGHFIEESYISK